MRLLKLAQLMTMTDKKEIVRGQRERTATTAPTVDREQCNSDVQATLSSATSTTLFSITHTHKTRPRYVSLAAAETIRVNVHIYVKQKSHKCVVNLSQPS